MKINVQHVAKLANLPLTAEENQQFEKQLAEVLTYIERLSEVDVTGITPTSQVTGLENVTREDIALPSLSQTEALANTTAKKNNFFQVKGILTAEES
jgi:aspartyl-tRNA(Asn)/glutamyl-tRNA(Gln) amidotransferase subunit C